jgi:hypothetical protein
MPKYNFWGDPIPDEGPDQYQLAPVAANPQRVDVATGRVSGGIGPGTYLPGESLPVWAAQLPTGATAGQAAQADANQLAGMVDLIAGKNISNAANPWGVAETGSRGSFARTPSLYTPDQASGWLSPAERTVLPHAQSAEERFAYSNTAPDFATQHQLALGGGSSPASAGGLTPGSWGDYGASGPGALIGRAPGPAPGPTTALNPDYFGGGQGMATGRAATPAEIATGMGFLNNPNQPLPQGPIYSTAPGPLQGTVQGMLGGIASLLGGPGIASGGPMGNFPTGPIYSTAPGPLQGTIQGMLDGGALGQSRGMPANIPGLTDIGTLGGPLPPGGPVAPQFPFGPGVAGTGGTSPQMAANLAQQMPGAGMGPQIQQLLQSLLQQSGGTGTGGSSPQMAQNLLQQLLASMGG